MSLTSIAGKLFLPRQKDLERYATEAVKMQQKVLKRLVEHGRHTEYGRKFGMQSSRYEDFAQGIPVVSYEELKGDIDRMRHGEANVLWPGRVKWYAKSSGTTNDKSKFIPVSKDGLNHIHYAGGVDVVALYLRNNPQSRLFDGRSLILGGSHSPNYNVANSLVGDLSAILIENINPLANLIRVPKKSTALLSDFELKRDLIARECLHKNVTNISGVPSYRARNTLKKCGQTSKFSFMVALRLHLIDRNIRCSSRAQRCTIWRRIMPVKASLAFKAISKIRVFC